MTDLVNQKLHIGFKTITLTVLFIIGATFTGTVAFMNTDAKATEALTIGKATAEDVKILSKDVNTLVVEMKTLIRTIKK